MYGNAIAKESSYGGTMTACGPLLNTLVLLAGELLIYFYLFTAYSNY